MIKKVDTSSAGRIKQARMLCGLTRDFIEKKYGLSKVTLKLWETPGVRKLGLAEKNADKLINIFLNEGIGCSKEWLQHGTGSGPFLLNNTMDTYIEEESITKEIKLFKECHENAIVQIITDDSMLPFFSVGEYVGGFFEDNPNNFDLYLGKKCILLIEEHGILIKTFEKDLKTSDSKGEYLAFSTNLSTLASPRVLYDIKLLKVAEIVWHRKKSIQPSSFDS